MTSPLHDSSRAPAGPARTPADNARARVKVARKWAYLISSSTYLPLSQREIDQAMHELVDIVFNVALSDPFTPEDAAGVGARLVDMRCTGPTSLRRTIDVLGKALLTEPELYRIDGKQDERAVQLLGVLASDYLESTRQFVFAQQEDIKSAPDRTRSARCGPPRPGSTRCSPRRRPASP
jgi:hypothetical protein